MGDKRKPSIFLDRANFGSEKELDEYGVFVKSESDAIFSIEDEPLAEETASPSPKEPAPHGAPAGSAEDKSDISAALFLKIAEELALIKNELQSLKQQVGQADRVKDSAKEDGGAEIPSVKDVKDAEISLAPVEVEAETQHNEPLTSEEFDILDEDAGNTTEEMEDSFFAEDDEETLPAFTSEELDDILGDAPLYEKAAAEETVAAEGEEAAPTVGEDFSSLTETEGAVGSEDEATASVEEEDFLDIPDIEDSAPSEETTDSVAIEEDFEIELPESEIIEDNLEMPEEDALPNIAESETEAEKKSDDEATASVEEEDFLDIPDMDTDAPREEATESAAIEESFEIELPESEIIEDNLDIPEEGALPDIAESETETEKKSDDEATASVEEEDFLDIPDMDTDAPREEATESAAIEESFEIELPESEIIEDNLETDGDALPDIAESETEAEKKSEDEGDAPVEEEDFLDIPDMDTDAPSEEATESAAIEEDFEIELPESEIIEDNLETDGDALPDIAESETEAEKKSEDESESDAPVIEDDFLDIPDIEDSAPSEEATDSVTIEEDFEIELPESEIIEDNLEIPEGDALPDIAETEAEKKSDDESESDAPVIEDDFLNIPDIEDAPSEELTDSAAIEEDFEIELPESEIIEDNLEIPEGDALPDIAATDTEAVEEDAFPDIEIPEPQVTEETDLEVPSEDAALPESAETDGADDFDIELPDPEEEGTIETDTIEEESFPDLEVTGAEDAATSDAEAETESVTVKEDFNIELPESETIEDNLEADGDALPDIAETDGGEETDVEIPETEDEAAEEEEAQIPVSQAVEDVMESESDFSVEIPEKTPDVEIIDDITLEEYTPETTDESTQDETVVDGIGTEEIDDITLDNIDDAAAEGGGETEAAVTEEEAGSDAEEFPPVETMEDVALNTQEGVFEEITDLDTETADTETAPEQDVEGEAAGGDVPATETQDIETDTAESADAPIESEADFEEDPALSQIIDDGVLPVSPPPEDTSYLDGSSNLEIGGNEEASTEDVSVDVVDVPSEPLEKEAPIETDAAPPSEKAPPMEADNAAPPPEKAPPLKDVPQDFKRQLRSVLSYMDLLLESLPEDKIEEFARSEYFDQYKKLFTELGLTENT